MCDCPRVTFSISHLLVTCITSNSCQFSLQNPTQTSKKNQTNKPSPLICYQVKNQDSFLVCKLSTRLLTEGQILRPSLKNYYLLDKNKGDRQHTPMICYHQQYICADRSQSQSSPSLLKHFLAEKTEKGCYPITSCLPTKFRKTVCYLNWASYSYRLRQNKHRSSHYHSIAVFCEEWQVEEQNWSLNCTLDIPHTCVRATLMCCLFACLSRYLINIFSFHMISD